MTFFQEEPKASIDWTSFLGLCLTMILLWLFLPLVLSVLIAPFDAWCIQWCALMCVFIFLFFIFRKFFSYAYVQFFFFNVTYIILKTATFMLCTYESTRLMVRNTIFFLIYEILIVFVNGTS